ncbi:MAG: glycosyltransferase family 4 protein [Bryobacteraceae bacterium]
MPPRVLIVAPSLRILGGQAVQAASLRERLREAGVSVDFLEVNPLLPGIFGELQKIKYVRTVLTEAAYITSLLLRVPKYDVLHIFSSSFSSFLIAPTPAILIGRLYGKRTLLNYRSGHLENHLKKWRTAVPTLQMTDRIVVPSGYLVDVFAKFHLRAWPIFNIVDTSRFQFRLRNPLRPVFLSNRNLEPIYNVGCTLKAFALVQRQFPESSLTIAGDGSERAALESQVAELRLQNVRFLGRVEHSRMHELYGQTDLYLNSSVVDNMPVSIIEAYASGTPLVTSDAGGIPYIVSHEETGLMVPQNNPLAMAEAALRYLTEPGLAERVTLNGFRECQNYQWPAVREQWISMYRDTYHGTSSGTTTST